MKITPNIRKYLKLYEEKRQESLEKWGYHYPPSTWKEFRDWISETYKNHLTEENNLEGKKQKTKIYVSLLRDDFQYFGNF